MMHCVRDWHPILLLLNHEDKLLMETRVVVGYKVKSVLESSLLSIKCWNIFEKNI